MGADKDAPGWEQFKHGVKKLRRNAPRPALTKPFAQSGAVPAPQLEQAVMPATMPARHRLDEDPQWRRTVERGEAPIDGRLDLHYRTESEAHAAVHSFISKAQHKGWRLLLIITGCGVVLQNVVPRWLREGPTAQYIRFIAPAAPQHGGRGAFYVVLHRRKVK